MTRALTDAPATHFRLKPETWAIIAEEYKNGATARDLGAKWKVAPTSVYRYACRDGWTKKGMSDGRARAHARSVEEDETARRSVGRVGTRVLQSLFAPAPVDEPDAGEPAALARLAALASGRAMRGRLWNEAKALTGLAECYQRMAAAEQARAAGTTETLPLTSVMDVRLASDERIAARFHINERPGVKDADRDLKESYWMVTRMREDVETGQILLQEDLKAHVARLEAMMRGAGMTPPEFKSRNSSIRLDARR